MRIWFLLLLAAVLIFVAARIAVFLVSMLIYAMAFVCVAGALLYAVRKYGDRGNRLD